MNASLLKLSRQRRLVFLKTFRVHFIALSEHASPCWIDTQAQGLLGYLNHSALIVWIRSDCQTSLIIGRSKRLACLGLYLGDVFQSKNENRKTDNYELRISWWRVLRGEIQFKYRYFQLKMQDKYLPNWNFNILLQIAK